MADYAPNFTGRYKVQYRGGLHVHTNTWRFEGAALAPTPDFVTYIGSFYSLLDGHFLTDWSFLGFQVAAKDSDLWKPAPNPGYSITVGAVPPHKGNAPVYMSFMGLTENNERASVTVFGVAWDPNSNLVPHQDYRIYATEDSLVAAAITQLTALGEEAGMVGIDGTLIRWHGYANIGYNSHYQRKQRG